MLWLIQDKHLNSFKMRVQSCLMVVTAAFDCAPEGGRRFGLCIFILFLVC